MDCSLPGSYICGIFQARRLEWVAISFSRRSSQPRNWTQVSHIVGRRFTVWATREVPRYVNSLPNAKGLPRWWISKESSCQCKRHNEFDPWVRKIPWSRKWQPTPVFLPGKFCGQRSLTGYSPWSHRVRHDWVTEHTPNTNLLFLRISFLHLNTV